MTDLLLLAAFILSLLAYSRTRQATARFEREIAELRAEIAQLSAVPGAEAVATLPPVPASADGAEADAVTEPVDETVLHDAREPAAAEAASDDAETAVPPRETFESQLGARWAVWVGGIALALGGVFLVKVSIDAELLSPAVRLALAALFGLSLMGTGEAIRRRAGPSASAAFGNAMIPGILTAAGAVTLLGTVFAAHALYGFLGPVAAFCLMALVSLAVLGLSLLHGQALAGLGLAASLVTPLLIEVDDPSPWSLFAFLTLVWLAALATARFGRWRIVPALANLGLGLWATVYLIAEDPAVTLPVSLALVVLVAGLAGIWPAAADDAASLADETPSAVPDPPDGEGAALPAEAAGGLGWRRLLLPRHAPVVLTGAFAVLLAALSLIGPLTEADGDPTVEFVVVIAALALLGALRPGAAAASVVAGLTAALGVATLATLPDLLALASVGIVADRPFATSLLAPFSLAALFIAAGTLALHRHRQRPAFAILWAGIAGTTSVACLALSFLLVGAYGFDLPHGLAALAAAVACIAVVVSLARRAIAVPPLAQGLLLAAALGHVVIAAHALANGLWTVLAMAAAAAAFAAVTRLRIWSSPPWPALPWIAVLGFGAVLARIGWEPTIVGPLHLGRTPVFNALLPGYGIPALLALWTAYTLRDWPSDRLRNALQAIASLFCLLTLAILVRHAMNGGQLQGSLPSLSEQSIYTLLVIGASAILLRLDLSRPGSFLRLGGMGLGVLSMIMTLSAHLIGLNPYLTGELLGPYPVVDLLLIGYLLPALAYAAMARMAVGRRPPAFIAALATASAVLAFAWATLSVRRAWQGESIADWKGFLAGETYTYSVVWLGLGVLLLMLSLRFHSRAMRIVSAVLVFVAVMKVFLFDMANLEGLLRALSFIGLGIVLIGIGQFYQKVLTRKPKAIEPPSPAGGEGGA